MAEKKSGLTRDVIPLVGVVALAGTGLYLAMRKPPAVRLGDKITLSMVSFEYTGPERAENDPLYICWGLKKGIGNFDNGANLAGRLWKWGGPMPVTTAKKYSFIPDKDFEHQPVLYLDPDILEAKNYDTYIWVVNDIAIALEDKKFLAIDTDADAVKISKE